TGLVRLAMAIATPCMAAISAVRSTARHRCHRYPDARAKANASAERVIGTLRREYLDRLIVLDEQHLRSVLAECVGYYHRSVRIARWLPTPKMKPRPMAGAIRSRPIWTGLHHAYDRVA
ncbi:MAG TPA: hypothetical protein VK898_08070, partial [Chloroflexota bacterium]|nr:hypothetical protein [Chloroflexota bacterium]